MSLTLIRYYPFNEKKKTFQDIVWYVRENYISDKCKEGLGLREAGRWEDGK